MGILRYDPYYVYLTILNVADEDAQGSEDYESTSEESESTEDEDEDRGEGPSSLTRQAEAEDARAEAAIEGDFDRLIQNIRDAGDGSSSGMLNRMWEMNLEEREAEFKDDLRAASGVGKLKKKVRFCPLAAGISAFRAGENST